MSGLRVVHVSDCFPPRVGGIETQVRDLAARQAAAGEDVHVLTATADPALPGGGRRGSSVVDGVRVHRFASRATLGAPFHPLEDVLLPRALRQLRPDVVHVHAGVVSPFAFAGATAARRLGLPLGITWHCMLDGIVPALRVGARATGWDDAPAAVSAVSAVAAERVAAALDRPTAEVLAVPNGLDLTRWAPAGPDLPADLPPSGPLRVVATQRLAPRKRAVPLVRIVAAAAERLGAGAGGAPRVRLDVFGDGPAAAAARAEARRRGVADVVTLHGTVPRAELSRHYAGAHVFLSPSRLEAFGIAALEARAGGLAVVAGRGTGITEFVVDGVDGLLAPDRSAGLDDAAADAALTDALVRLAEDGDLLGRILAHNRAVPPAVGWPDVLAAAQRLYDRARSLV
ncbi:glycosyltransferase involved in cell wall biosynthesis [Georgenia soli]|uniref:D-inositol 3-phosphate glycosyltransferase n=1 Tax=Georgenia soli TaxID=638953 RepID=A0A2A9ENZ0_9MICO|nr:glycosyltransferase family 4 protein [Georgenia soli]PFG40513.1 glycosyltransferase involved in cell wall biosynthesis [Georgenia soli]